MGQALPRAVQSISVNRVASATFRIGMAEMNGWRPSMEDSHVIHAKGTWGFFGVFDGHGGGACSAFIAKRLEEELEKGPPADDAAVTALALRLDKEFLAAGKPSGSTGTFVIVTAPVAAGGKYHLRVGNIGDSRVLLGRADGTMVEGSGTDGGLTTDHKPDAPSERARIDRAGGYVEDVMGVARVNGDLAVSRAFGDAQYKQAKGSADDTPVSAAPELTNLECDPSDFLLLVCDGISEGSFPNRDVVRLAAETMRGGEGVPDPGAAATAVCREALTTGSQDNLSCMIVLLGGGDVPGPENEHLPGPFDGPRHTGFRTAYAAMAERAGLTFAAAVEKRHDVARARLKELPESGDEARALRSELAAFGDGPPCTAAMGTDERTQWFASWLDEQKGEGGENDGIDLQRLLMMAQTNPQVKSALQARGLFTQLQVLPVDKLRSAVEAHPALKWDEKLVQAAGQVGTFMGSDPTDDTSKIYIAEPLNVTLWLPNSAMSAVTRLVRIAPLERLRPAVEAHDLLTWDDRMAGVCGREGTVVQEDASDGTSQVKFLPPVGMVMWLPTDMLSSGAQPDEGAGDPEEEDGGEAEPKRQRTE